MQTAARIADAITLIVDRYLRKMGGKSPQS
jgi:hypothetical protein